ncbi:MAG: RHS repeat-associated core domain-containing protein [Phycisphaerales bacterium]
MRSTITTFDFDGNNNLTGGSDIDDSNAFDAAQKITSRTSNKAGGGTVNTAHTVPGAVTDDARTLDAVVYDAWNRLISVQARGSLKDAAIYRYDGTGHRIEWTDDVTLDGAITGADPAYHVVYTEDWRMLAVYRGSDANPKERHVPHFAGLNGYGNAAQGGIDGEILRDRDASTGWASAADGLDERRYICQNWRGDVSAIITDGGIMIEWTKYTAYGEPIGLPTGDVDSDGDWDSTDSTAILGHGGAYDARYDVNLDGVIDADDAGDAVNYNGGGTYTIGSGKVSGANTANRKGYAGYEHDRVMPAFLTHVRHRAYRMDLGRFMQPDPLGYVDGVNRWGYGDNAPIRNRDQYGLASCDTCDQTTKPSRPDDRPPQPRQPTSFEQCQANLKNCLNNDTGVAQQLQRLSACQQRSAYRMNGVFCASCPPGVQGGYDCRTRTIIMCMGQTGAGTCETLRHELQHAIDDCLGLLPCPGGNAPSATDCIFLACSEIRAYNRAGQCCPGGSHYKPGVSYSDCIRKAATISLSVFGCPSPGQTVEDMMLTCFDPCESPCPDEAGCGTPVETER